MYNPAGYIPAEFLMNQPSVSNMSQRSYHIAVESAFYPLLCVHRVVGQPDYHDSSFVRFDVLKDSKGQREEDEIFVYPGYASHRFRLW
jgi:hypothetical protein